MKTKTTTVKKPVTKQKNPKKSAAPKKASAPKTNPRKELKKSSGCASSSGSARPKILSMSFAKVYPLYVAKAAKVGRSKQEVDEVICWLTGYTQKRLEQLVAQEADFEAFLLGAKLNPKRNQITGKVCGVEVSQVEDPSMREIRYMDKLIDELAKGKTMDMIQRK
jgi:hypothetical protein